MKRTDLDIGTKVYTFVRSVNETLQYTANEPSLALYRIQEHAHKVLPTMTQRWHELQQSQKQMNDIDFAMKDNAESLKYLANCHEFTTNIMSHLEKACATSKQINLLRQQQMQQIMFEKKDAPLLSST